MKYAKLENGKLVFPPNPFLFEGRKIYYTGIGAQLSEILTKCGYMPIVETPYPQPEDEADEKYYTESWQEAEGEIVRVWLETDPPEPEPLSPTMEQRVTTLENDMNSLMGAIQEGLEA